MATITETTPKARTFTIGTLSHEAKLTVTVDEAKRQFMISGLLNAVNDQYSTRGFGAQLAQLGVNTDVWLSFGQFEALAELMARFIPPKAVVTLDG